jgi:hypothetical protein
MNGYYLGIVGLFAAGVSLTTDAAVAQDAIILAVHNEQSTHAFIADHGLPSGQGEGGRFAVAKLISGAWGDSSYALVYVPAGLSAAKNDHVALTQADASILKTPGKAVVTRIWHDGVTTH